MNIVCQKEGFSRDKSAIIGGMNGLDTTLSLLAAAVLGVVAFRMLQLPPMLGYLVVGIFIGPFGMGVADDSAVTHELAEFGVVFLMFSIGLEFSLSKLMAMRKAVFGLGMAQVLVTILTSMLFGWIASRISRPSTILNAGTRSRSNRKSWAHGPGHP